MKLTQSLLAFALAGGLMSAANADTTYNMGPLTSTPYINTATVSAGTVFTLPPTGSIQYNFTDTYNFSVAGLPATASTGVSVNLNLGSLSFHISNMKLDLFNASNGWIAGDLVSGSSDNTVDVNAVLTNGDYYFLVRGFADGAGTNQGIYTFTAAAVPEAETYAMMLAGLGLVGFMVSRRRAVVSA
jgi:hypothetical protein